MTAMMTVRTGDPLVGAQAAYAMLHGQVMRQSLILAFDDAFAATTAIGTVLLLVIATMRRSTDGPAPATGGH